SVSSLPHLTVECCDRCRVNNHAAFFAIGRIIQHCLGTQADNIKSAIQIYVDDLGEISEGKWAFRTRSLNSVKHASTVDYDSQVVVLIRDINSALYVVLAGDIGRREDNIPLDVIETSLIGLRQVNDHNTGAGSCQHGRGGKPEPGSATGYYCGLCRGIQG